MNTLLDCVELQTQENVQYSVIWMHGLGADANDFVPIVPELRFPEPIGVRFIFPNAPVRSITINNGIGMRAWFDILSLERIEREEDEEGLYTSKTQIEALIQRENDRGIPSERIFLAGFSQGCAMTLFTGLRYPQKLAGLIGLSGYLPLYQRTSDEASTANKDTPIFLVHGDFDPVIPIRIAEISRQKLAELGYPIEWHQYPMAHQVCSEEVADINHFMLKHMVEK